MVHTTLLLYIRYNYNNNNNWIVQVTDTQYARATSVYNVGGKTDAKVVGILRWYTPVGEEGAVTIYRTQLLFITTATYVYDIV